MSGMGILVTGGCGFIGSNFIRLMLARHPDWRIRNIDKLTYAGRLENAKDFAGNPNYEFVRSNICDKSQVEAAMKDIDWVVHFAAESHVDRSISDHTEFLKSNVEGTCVLLDAASKAGVKKFVHISTDEVYGSIQRGSFKETRLLHPRSPYSASKAAAEMFVHAYRETHGLKTVITRSSNNYGPYQFPEKLIPLFITNLMRGKKVPVYGTGLNVRDWLYVEDNCEGIEAALLKGKDGEIYNIGGGEERTNLEITKMILAALGKPESMIEHVEDRKGHDFRYSLDCSKIKKETGFAPKVKLEEGLKKTVDWYMKNEWWWAPLTDNKHSGGTQ